MKTVRPLLHPLLMLASIAALFVGETELHARSGVSLLGPRGHDVLQALAYLGIAWLLSRISNRVLSGVRPNDQPVPRLLGDLVSGFLFLSAIASGSLLLAGHGSGSILAGSGVLLALLGFAIRNVVADALSGVALGLEGPFRIGDWIDIDGMARGRVVEIGWHTTRLLTRDSTYVILPNSQISRQRIVNYSVPRSEFRAQVEITLSHALPATEGAEILRKALESATLIRQMPPPDMRIQSIQPEGCQGPENQTGPTILGNWI